MRLDPCNLILPLVWPIMISYFRSLTAATYPDTTFCISVYQTPPMFKMFSRGAQIVEHTIASFKATMALVVSTMRVCLAASEHTVLCEGKSLSECTLRYV